jgi:hypothetical protein
MSKPTSVTGKVRLLVKSKRTMPNDINVAAEISMLPDVHTTVAVAVGVAPGVSVGWMKLSVEAQSVPVPGSSM